MIVLYFSAIINNYYQKQRPGSMSNQNEKGYVWKRNEQRGTIVGQQWWCH
ncbi:hypothetical protein HMPREF1870_00671 [Bacteroidales bacterium KA00344]|nr:hypothetical protein HMPREF1870_00671 [Bacteroidales bacterium KA00344]